MYKWVGNAIIGLLTIFVGLDNNVIIQGMVIIEEGLANQLLTVIANQLIYSKTKKHLFRSIVQGFT